VQAGEADDGRHAAEADRRGPGDGLADRMLRGVLHSPRPAGNSRSSVSGPGITSSRLIVPVLRAARKIAIRRCPKAHSFT
jgi:hypothetical protein